MSRLDVIVKEEGLLSEEFAFQERALAGVSRTFALTIPCLPSALKYAVGNGYLLCRIADTIEDDPEMDAAQKRYFSDWFVQLVAGGPSIVEFTQELSAALSRQIPKEEQELIANVSLVLKITHSLSEREQEALVRCVGIMTYGMAYYQERETLSGVADTTELDRYCYHVAGVVGEMLTTLFLIHIPEMEQNKEQIMHLAVAFGIGLQMTNILKDIWDDRKRGVCWLPQSAFKKYDIDLENLEQHRSSAGYAEAMGYLIGDANGYLEDALTYTSYIPKHEKGVRQFCLWAIGMAVLTLRKIDQNRHFPQSSQVKISRNAVKTTITTIKLLHRSNFLLKKLFHFFSRSLPKRSNFDRMEGFERSSFALGSFHKKDR